MLPDVGGLEWLIIAVVALIVIGPKDLPVMMRKVGQFMAKLRGMAAEFRSSFDEMARQSELDDLRKEVEAMRRGQFADISDAAGVNEMQSTIAEIDQNLADVGVQLQPSYQYDSLTEPPAPTAVEAPKKARTPRTPKAAAKPRSSKVVAKPPVKVAAKAPAKPKPKAVAAKAATPRKPGARKAGGASA